MKTKLSGIEQLAQRRIEEDLRVKFPRIVRRRKYQFISQDFEKSKIDLAYRTSRLTRLCSPVHQGLSIIGESPIDDLVGQYLEHVVYKVIRNIYGLPDYTMLEIEFTDKNPDYYKQERTQRVHPIETEWSYLLQGPRGMQLEICQKHNRQGIGAVLWHTEPGMSVGVRTAWPEDFFKSMEQLLDFEAERYSIDRELQRLGNGKQHYVSFYRQYFFAGMHMLKVAEREEIWIEESRQFLCDVEEWGASQEFFVLRGTFYMSAMVLFWMSLEGFVNTLYDCLLLPHFRREAFQRGIAKQPIDWRILNLAAYCDGIDKNKIDINESLLRSLQRASAFRNDLLHVNITAEHQFKTLLEDGCSFLYQPLMDRSLLQRLEKKDGWFTAKQHYSESDALELKSLVESTVRTVMDWMTQEVKDWVGSWILGPWVSPPTFLTNGDSPVLANEIDLSIEVDSSDEI